MSLHTTKNHLARAEELVRKAHANGGLAPVDLDRFWDDDQTAWGDPWSEACPQVPLGIGMGAECAFAELGIPEEWFKLKHDEEYLLALAKRYNDVAEKTVGSRLLNETFANSEHVWPEIKGLHDIFEAKNRWKDMSYWLMPSANTPDRLASLFDRVERRLEVSCLQPREA